MNTNPAFFPLHMYENAARKTCLDLGNNPEELTHLPGGMPVLLWQSYAFRMHELSTMLTNMRLFGGVTS